MINELSSLYQSLDNAKIAMDEWHQKYTEIRSVAKTPCVRVIMNNAGGTNDIEAVDSQMAKQIRRYGSNQGSFPAMNLRPLYRITNEEDKKYLQGLMKKGGAADVERIRSLCREDNWKNNKFQGKYSVCMKVVPEEIRQLLSGNAAWPEMDMLLGEAAYYQEAEPLHKLLEEASFRLLKMTTETVFALQVLFHIGSAGKKAEDDGGDLTVVLDHQALIDKGIPVVGLGFTKEFNRKLLESMSTTVYPEEGDIEDAFGNIYDLPMDKANPMPAAVLTGGFKITLRTMYGQQYCQYRYGQADDGSYRISMDRRRELKKALEWIGRAENENITWARIDLNERLFAYPAKLTTAPPRAVRVFKRVSRESVFLAEAKQFCKELYGLREEGDDSFADKIQIFIIRKLDKARMKMVFTRVTSAAEIESRSRGWYEGSDNIPSLSIGKPNTLFPLESSDVLNLVLKQNGEEATDKFKTVSYYHGMELFFGAEESIKKDLSMLIHSAEKIAPMLVRQLPEGKSLSKDSKVEDSDKGESGKQRPTASGVIYKAQRITSLMGFLLLECDRRKEEYMESYAFLYGRLLRVSDELHRQYCLIERKGDIPPQLVGGGMYISAIDSPTRTLGLLGQRMLPYIMWAKTYHDDDDKRHSEGLVKWLLSEYGETAGKLKTEIEQHESGRFSELDKAEFFLGYIASFSKKDKDVMNTENGGEESE